MTIHFLYVKKLNKINGDLCNEWSFIFYMFKIFNEINEVYNDCLFSDTLGENRVTNAQFPPPNPKTGFIRGVAMAFLPRSGPGRSRSRSWQEQEQVLAGAGAGFPRDHFGPLA